MSNTTAEAPKSQHYVDIKEGNDPFAGVVAIFEDTDLKQMGVDKRYHVEHQRKDIYTDYMTLGEAEKQFEEFISDAVF